MDEIEMRVQIQLDGPEITHSSETRDSHQRIDSSKNQAKPSRPIRILSKPCPKRDYPADDVKHIVGGRKREIEHFVAKESHGSDHDQYRSDQHDIDCCQRASHDFDLQSCQIYTA